jgi:hypothetical protein
MMDFRIYASNNPIDELLLPEPIAIISDLKSFREENVESDGYRYYRVGAEKGGHEKVSDELRVWCSDRDEYYEQVELLLLANATSYPSTTIVDKSKYARTVTRGGVSIVNSIETIDGGAFDFTNSSGVRYLQTSISTLNTSDFDIELEMKVNSYSQYYPRVFVFGSSEGVVQGGFQFQIASDGRSTLFINNGSIKLVGMSINPIGSALMHHRIARKDGVFYYYIEGVLQSIDANYLSYNINQSNFRLGGFDRNIVGYKSSVRITKGTTRYSLSGFTPPNEMFPTS